MAMLFLQQKTSLAMSRCKSRRCHLRKPCRWIPRAVKDRVTDPMAERARKLGGTTIRSIGHIARLSRVLDNDADYVTPTDMLAELRDDNQQLAARMRAVHAVADEHRDVATASLLETWIDEAEGRTWFLFEASRRAEQ